MRFNCGPTKEEKERRLRKLMEDRGEMLYKEGESWFAWRPVRLDNDECAWLERVHRKATHFYSSYYSEWITITNVYYAREGYQRGKSVKFTYSPIDKAT